MQEDRYYLNIYGPYFKRIVSDDILTDEEVVFLITDGLFWDTWVDSEKIELKVEKGIVTLRGTASSQLEKRAAGDTVWDTPGVLDVNNEIRVEGVKY